MRFGMGIFGKRDASGACCKHDYRHSVFAILCEPLHFCYLALRARWVHCLDFLYVLFRGYPRSWLFMKLDKTLRLEYFLESPFAISKRYLQLRLDSDIYQYGETPMRTLERIAQRLKLSSDDHVFELGAGTGRCAFWLACLHHCRVTGIERIALFADFANSVVRNYGLQDQVQFIHGDFLEKNLSQATVIYLYGTKMSDAEIEVFILNLRNTTSGTRIVTVSYALEEIVAISSDPRIQIMSFEITDAFEAEFFWGKAQVFIQKLRSRS